jgi:hypothetical protein
VVLLKTTYARSDVIEVLALAVCSHGVMIDPHLKRSRKRKKWRGGDRRGNTKLDFIIHDDRDGII